MARPLENVIMDQITPIVGPEQARLISGVAEKFAQILTDDFDYLEDHVTLPALASLLGYFIRTQTAVATERQKVIDAGIDIQPPLFQGEQVMLALIAATKEPDPRPNHQPMRDYYTRQRQLEYATEMFEQGIEDDAVAGVKH